MLVKTNKTFRPENVSYFMFFPWTDFYSIDEDSEDSTDRFHAEIQKMKKQIQTSD